MTAPSDVASVPTISIGMPVYNGEETLAAALDSLLAQTFQDFEVVICDNASTDGTAAIVEAYAKRDDRIRYHRADENQGAATNFGWAVELSRGEFFKWHAADDIILPEFLEACMAPLLAHPDVVLCFSSRKYITYHGQPLSDEPHLLRYRQLPQDDLDDLSLTDLLRIDPNRIPLLLFGLIRRSVLATTGPYGAYHGADVRLLYELRLHGRFAQVPRPLYVQRDHLMTSEMLSRLTRKGDAAFYGTDRGLTVHSPEAKLLLEMVRARDRAVSSRDPEHSDSGALAQARELLALRAHLEIRAVRYLSNVIWQTGRPVFERWARVSESFLTPDAPNLRALRVWRGGAAAARGRFRDARALLHGQEAARLLTESLGRLLDRSSHESLSLLADWLASEDAAKARLAMDAYTMGAPDDKARFLAHLDDVGAHEIRARLEDL